MITAITKQIPEIKNINRRNLILNRRNPNKGNVAIEYAVLIIILVSALLLMQTYITRAFAGRWHSVGDTFGYGRQYEPGVTTVTEVGP